MQQLAPILQRGCLSLLLLSGHLCSNTASVCDASGRNVESRIFHCVNVFGKQITFAGPLLETATAVTLSQFEGILTQVIIITLIRTYSLKPGSLYDWSNYWSKGIQFRSSVRQDVPYCGLFTQLGQLHTIYHIW